MRIISGTAKGRRLAVPAGHDVRPTADRVREAVFNALYSAGAFDESPGRTAVDLFAGTGALGLEALSRGIGHVWFVDRSRDATATVTQNVEALGFADRASVVRSEAETWLEVGPLRVADLVFCDPPYGYDAWPTLLELVRTHLRPELVVIESDTPVEVGSDWAEFKTARYGSTVVQIARAGTSGQPNAGGN